MHIDVYQHYTYIGALRNYAVLFEFKLKVGLGVLLNQPVNSQHYTPVDRTENSKLRVVFRDHQSLRMYCQSSRGWQKRWELLSYDFASL